MIDAVSQFLEKGHNRVEKYRTILHNMLGDGAYQYASETLLGILDDIDSEERVTVAQIEAINNIRAKPSYDRY